MYSAAALRANKLYEPDVPGVNTPMDPDPAAHPAPTLENSSFEALLEAVGQRQDRAAFITLFGHFAPRIKSFLMKGGATPDQADELAQDTMLSVWQKAPSFDPKKAAASTWIFTIARNKRIDSLRRTARAGIDPLADPALVEDEQSPPGEGWERHEEAKVMGEALRGLPPEQAELIRKSYFEDKTHSDIARETNLPLGTVKSRIRLALDKLREDMKVRQLWQ